MAGNNAVYDLSRYEDVHNEQQESQKEIRVAKTAAESGSALKIIFMSLLAALVMAAVIHSKVQQASIHAEIISLTAQVNELASENVRMETEIERKSALNSVEEYASNVLGMQKLDKAQIEYLSLENGNVIEISENSDNIFVKAKHWLEDFVEYLKG
ncbi:MAG: hypothetical protein IJZ72_03860 [Oscillospiraceae bacterium]|nr:hypothetical protein [Oscillospiraceae bacterium]